MTYLCRRLPLVRARLCHMILYQVHREQATSVKRWMNPLQILNSCSQNMCAHVHMRRMNRLMVYTGGNIHFRQGAARRKCLHPTTCHQPSITDGINSEFAYVLICRSFSFTRAWVSGSWSGVGPQRIIMVRDLKLLNFQSWELGGLYHATCICCCCSCANSH